MKIFEAERDLEVVVLPGEREPAVGGQHLVPLVHVNDLGEGQAEHHHQGGVVQRGRSTNHNIRTSWSFGDDKLCSTALNTVS